MALAPANHLALFHTIPRRSVPSTVKLLILKSLTSVNALAEEDILEGCEAVRTNIPGSVWKVLVKEGQKVEKGESIMVLESMKMEFAISATVSGTVEKIYLEPGDQVDAGQLAICIK